MKTSSLRLRVTVATVVVLALSLAGFAVAVTLDYRGGLERDLRNRLAGGGLALSRTPSSEIKQVVSSLALEGIEVKFGPQGAPVGNPGKSGRQPPPTAAALAKPASLRTQGNLLVLEIPVTATEGPGAGASPEDPGRIKGTGHGRDRASANLHATAGGALASLVRAGKIDRHQAEVIDGQVDAGSVDPRELVSRGIVSERQIGAVMDAIDAVKRSAQPQSNPTVLATLTASQSSVDTPVHQLIVAEAAAGLAAVALATLLLLWGLRAALSPLAHVGRVAARIAAGDRGQRLNPERPNTELGRMAASFDEMVSALDASVQQSHRSEAAMRRFLADASHELRTPIAALQATVETLLREQPPRPERDALEAQLARESARLGALVDDLLSLARLEGSDSLDGERVDLAELAEQVVAEMRIHAPRVMIEFERTDGAIVEGDAEALGRALRNLLDNALAATDERGQLRVEVRRLGAEVVLRVTDDGPGVPPDQRELIFEDFVRLGGNGRRGAGLGLAIVRRTAEQHRGEVVCEDTKGGASFLLGIPAAPAPAVSPREQALAVARS